MIGPVRVLAAIAGVALVAFVSYLGSGPGSADADVRSGQYSLEVAVGETSVASGGQFAAYVGVYHGAGNYQAAQWDIDYNEAILDVVSIGKDPGAPAECGSSNDNQSRVLLGCISLNLGSGMGYSGNAFIIGFKCIANGTANLTFVAATTWVRNGDNVIQPGHTHTDSVTCGSGGPPPPPPPGDSCTVSEVLTGDTFKCADGKTVRMLQIDAQDLNQCGGGWAKAALQYIFLTPGRVVTLEYDSDKTDNEGRTLAAPIALGTDGAYYNMSIVMVYVGLAKAADFGDGNVKFLDWAKASQTWASVAQWNMWAPNKTYTGGCD